MAQRGRPRVEKGRRSAFAARFRAARIRRGMTQRQAADALGVHIVSVARYETGVMVPRGPGLRFIEAWIAEAATIKPRRKEEHRGDAK